jgi:CxxC motif-containing protein (DUF1111 family)
MVRLPVVVIVAVFYSAAGAGLRGGNLSVGDPEAGRALFGRTWTVGADGAGLGPLFNEHSCVACHSLGGIGGGGANFRNVDVLSVYVPNEFTLSRDLASGPVAPGPWAPPSQKAIANLRRDVLRLHPAFSQGAFVFHSFGTDPRYDTFREELLRGDSRRPDGEVPVRVIAYPGVTLHLSARNSTALFGAGLLDQVSESDLRQVAMEQARNHPAQRGRPLGRFGWRGQIVDLRSFVVAACAGELGLEVPGGQLPVDPFKAPTTVAAGTVPKFDLSEEQLTDLTAFVGSLPPPVRRAPADTEESLLVARGEALFGSTGCAVCHREKLGPVTGLYSDLLVHDMGPYLSDQLAAPEAANSAKTCLPPRSLGESLGKRVSEWRTPPLWGVADSGPYLHDGRAETIEQAIVLHGGQGAASAKRFAALKPDDRGALLKFLSTLTAPKLPARGRLPAEGRRPDGEEVRFFFN